MNTAVSNKKITLMLFMLDLFDLFINGSIHASMYNLVSIEGTKNIHTMFR